MHKKSLFPIIYGMLSALIAFIAVFFICLRSFRWSLPSAILAGGLFAICFFVLSWFRGHASVEIKRITQEYHLSDQDLARITGMKASDFPVYQDKLQLILPKRYWPKILEALQKYERERKQVEL
ncbi:hypothetical protein OZY43_07125 [Lactobacillus sp. ESL0785]|uniref:hypothetical protein n=1 Tax=Lactobacillus sp. ESL0785 TaxID=2983232 RepID=UPI0023F7E184|nr:hypothetical protein [Lactobacillus sp. ESL0785]WEV70702.1 hypothetical protein OZY43_07125 [Lactobacillus sp. ESL0785]